MSRVMSEHGVYALPQYISPEKEDDRDQSPKAIMLRELRKALRKVQDKIRENDLKHPERR
jgi:hypothetical protein